MYSISIGNTTLNRYKLQWHSYSGKQHYVKKTTILHSISLQDVKRKALSLFGSNPDNIVKI